MYIGVYSYQISKRATIPKEECNNLELKIAKHFVCYNLPGNIF
jgi:hypothetical protein